MHRVIVIQFITIDGVTQDPDGTEGFTQGGWAFRHGPQAIAGDKFQLGELLETGTLLLGRRTWQKFSGIWPSQSDDFSTRMNRIRKLVASSSLEQLDAWNNSMPLGGELVEEVERRRQDEDLIVAGSDSIVQTLMRHDLIDEYRLLIFPVVLGDGRRLFSDGTAPINLQLVSAERRGEAVLVTYQRNTAGQRNTASQRNTAGHGNTATAR